MKRKLVVVVTGLLFALVLSSISEAGGLFVATAKNFRGALYQGFGPSPQHASEMAMVKCSQDSFAPPSCRIIGVRMECPPPVCAPPMRKPIRKASVVPQAGPYYGPPMR